MKTHAPQQRLPQQEKSPQHSLQKQRAAGNRAAPVSSADGLEVARGAPAKASFAHDFSRIPLHSGAPVKLQAKLTVNTPGDIFEQEADRIAERVISTNSDGTDDLSLESRSVRKIQAKLGAIVPASGGFEVNGEAGNYLPVQDGGAPLPSAVRAYMEPRFGLDFSRVRVHTDAQSQRLNRALNARAFTVGHGIFFRQGEYDPGSRSGQQLIAHELTHVVQQTGGHGGTIGGHPESDSIRNHEVQTKDGSAKPARPGTDRPTHTPAPAVCNAMKISPTAPFIQRDIVDTHEFENGEMSIDFKKKEGIKPGNKPGIDAGEEGQIIFKPHPDAPDMNVIPFVQIVRTFDTEKEKDFRYRGPEAPRNKMRTKADEDEGVEPGFYVDQLAGKLKKRKKEESTEPKVLPYYDRTVGGTRNRVGWKKGAALKPAILADWPSSNFPLKFDFVTSAVETDTQTWLGSVSWGFEVACEGRKEERLCRVTNEHHEFSAERGATTDSALKKFDKYYRNPKASTAPKED